MSQETSLPKMVRRYDGQNAGRVLLPLIHSARRQLFVCSPFIGPGYARLLVQKARSGVDVYVLTSLASENRTHKEALAVLTSRPPPMLHQSLIPITFGFLFLFFSLLHSSWVFMYLGAMFLAIGLVYSFRKLRAPRHRSGLQLRISRAFIHAKIYGADDAIAATGSANLTFSGLNRNVEHVEIFEGSEASPVIDSFYELWNRSSPTSLS